MKGRHARNARLPARLLSSGLLIGGLGVPAVAHAQTLGGPSVTPSSQIYPQRFVGSALQNVRPQNLNPTGINYADCASDMTLRYSVGIQGFNGQDVQVWVSATSDCTNDMNRGNGLNPTCWLVSAQSAVQQFSLRTIQIDIPVRAIVAGLNRVPAPTGMVGDQLITACQSQTSPSAVSFTVFILPVQSPSTYTGTGFQQVLPVDMVGPQAPVLTNPPINPGDTFLTASWTANGDSDTIGYDVFLEQVTGIAGSAPDGAIPTVTVCNDSGAGQADAGQDADDGSASSIDSGDDSSASSDSGDATVSSDASLAFEASCRTTSVGAPPPQVSLCGTSSALSSAISSDAGSSIAPATTTDDGAVVLDDAAATPSGPGGVATIDCSFLIGGNCSAGQPAYTSTSITLSGKANNSSIIKDLTDGVKYNYTVAAVDAFGNPGPPATVQCGTPAKVNDFFTIYRESGGRGGGGFCALDVVGEHSETSLGLAGLGLGAALVARRRRSRRS